MSTETRALNEIAWEVRQEWPKVNFAAEPYLAAMEKLTTMSDRFYEDPARDVVLYFLNNTKTWRGDTARRIKAELRSMLAARS